MNPIHEYRNALTRRTFLAQGGLNLGAVALWSLLNERSHAAGPLAPRPPHFAPRAKHVIYLHMIGSPSQLDLYDYKPELVKRDGQICPDDLLKGKRFAFIGGKMALAGTKFHFARHGRSGQELSELLPNL